LHLASGTPSLNRLAPAEEIASLGRPFPWAALFLADHIICSLIIHGLAAPLGAFPARPTSKTVNKKGKSKRCYRFSLPFAVGFAADPVPRLERPNGRARDCSSGSPGWIYWQC
jgi:hypothetical protein